MRVILLKDVAKVGQRGAVKEVADGYGLNYLLPRGLAQQATAEALASASKRQEAESRSRSEAREKTQAVLKRLDGQKITISARANKQGHLFKSVRPDDVAAAIMEYANVALDPEMIALGVHSIKDTGEYAIHLAGEGMEAAVTLVVEAVGSAN